MFYLVYGSDHIVIINILTLACITWSWFGTQEEIDESVRRRFRTHSISIKFMQHVIVLIIDWWTINIELYVLLIFLIKPLIVHTLIDNYKEYILINSPHDISRHWQTPLRHRDLANSHEWPVLRWVSFLTRLHGR